MQGLVVGFLGVTVISIEIKNGEASASVFVDNEVSRTEEERKTKPGAKLSMNGGG